MSIGSEIRPLLPGNWRPLRLGTLVGLRWLAVIGQTIGVLFVAWGLGYPLPLVECLSLIALSVVVNLVLIVRFGAGNLRGAFWTVDTLLGGGQAAPYDGYVHFDFKPPRAEGLDGVWESARGCMRNYLILRERALAFRADPEVGAALDAARVGELSTPTVAPGESLSVLREADYDLATLSARSVAMEALDQLAMDHLLGAR